MLHPTPTLTPPASTLPPDTAEVPAPLAAPEAENPGAETTGDPSSSTPRLTTSKLAKALGLKTAELTEHLIARGLLELRDGKTYITAAGKGAGGEFRMSPKFGPYFLWPADLAV